MSEDHFRRILSAHPAALLEESPAQDFKVQIENRSFVQVQKQVLLRFFIGGKKFEETFMILPSMGNFIQFYLLTNNKTFISMSFLFIW